MFICKFIAVFLAVFICETGFAEQTSLKLSWANFTQVFYARYLERSPLRNDEHIAHIKAALSQGFHLNPELSTQVSFPKTLSTSDPTTSVTVSQSFPWGTSLSASLTSSKATNFNARQELLKSGLLFGLTPDKIANLEEKINLHKAEQAFYAQYNEALTSFLSATLAAREEQLSKQALNRALEQKKVIENSITEGQTAKADLLIYLLAVQRFELQSAQATLSKEAAERQVGEKLWQKTGDPSLELDTTKLPEKAFVFLNNLAWPQNIPTVVEANLNLDIAVKQAQLAQREALPALGVWTAYENVVQNDKTITNSTWGLDFKMPLGEVIMRNNAKLANYATQAEVARAEETLISAHNKQIEYEKNSVLWTQKIKAAENILELSKQSVIVQKQKYEDGKLSIEELRRSQDAISEAEVELETYQHQFFLHLLSKTLYTGQMGKLLSFVSEGQK